VTSKERMLVALSDGTPDRLPATIHQWQDFHLKTFMGGMTDVEAFHDVGLDAAITQPVRDASEPVLEGENLHFGAGPHTARDPDSGRGVVL